MVITNIENHFLDISVVTTLYQAMLTALNDTVATTAVRQHFIGANVVSRSQTLTESLALRY